MVKQVSHVVRAQQNGKALARSIAAVFRALVLRWRLLCLAVLRFVVLDTELRGKDQRRPWIRALALVHPAARLALVLVAALSGYWLWVVLPSWSADGECTALSFRALHLCGALLQLGAAAVAGGAAGGSVLYVPDKTRSAFARCLQHSMH